MPRDVEPTSAPQATIELRFLSGTALGRCHYATGDCVSVGDDQACDVRIPAGDCDARQRCRVHIRSSSSGWYLSNLGTSTVAVNHGIVTGETRLKSGDVIRLSLSGPDMMFSIVADRNRLPLVSEPTLPEVQLAPPERSHTLMYVGAGIVALALVSLLVVSLSLMAWIMRPNDDAATPRPATDTAMSLRSVPGQVVDEGRRWELDLSDYVSPALPDAYAFRPVSSLPLGMQLDQQTGKLTWTPSESQGPGAYPIKIEVRSKTAGTTETAALTVGVREVNAPPRLQAISDTTFAWGTSAALEVQVMAVDDDQPKQPIKFRLGENAPPGMVVDPDTGLVRWAPQLEHVGKTYPAEILAYDPETSQAPQKVQFRVTVTRPATAAAPKAKEPATPQLADTLYLLVIEEPTSGTVFPFAVAFAVRDDLLVTSGAVVQELAKVRDKGRVAFAINCVSQNQEDITALYLNPQYARSQDRPEDQIYSDVGAVQLAGGKRSVAPLAAAADAAVLEQGAPLQCVMPVFEAEPLTKFDDITPSYHSAKIYMVTRGGDTDAPPDTRPRLLALVGTLPKNAYGSPIVNAQGQVVAVYVEKADLANNQSLASLADRYHYALCLDALAGLLAGDGLAAWQLGPKTAGDGAPPGNQ